MMKIASSKRLQYRMMDAGDAALLLDLDNDPAVMKFINGGRPTSADEIENIFIPRLNAYRDPGKGWGLWAVNIIDTEDFIGWILVRPMDFFSDGRDDTDLELGWRFTQKSWGFGYATEAARAIMNAFIARGEYRAISAVADAGNVASIAVMTKLGMRYIKTDIHKDPLGDAECVFYSRPAPKNFQE